MGSTAQAAGLDAPGQQFAQAGFNDGRLAEVDQVDFILGNIHSDNFVATCREATGAHGTDVTQTKYANAHRVYLCHLKCGRARNYGE